MSDVARTRRRIIRKKNKKHRKKTGRNKHQLGIGSKRKTITTNNKNSNNNNNHDYFCCCCYYYYYSCYYYYYYYYLLPFLSWALSVSLARWSLVPVVEYRGRVPSSPWAGTGEDSSSTWS